jgi:hypothetical protein
MTPCLKRLPSSKLAFEEARCTKRIRTYSCPSSTWRTVISRPQNRNITSFYSMSSLLATMTGFFRLFLQHALDIHFYFSTALPIIKAADASMTPFAPLVRMCLIHAPVFVLPMKRRRCETTSHGCARWAAGSLLLRLCCSRTAEDRAIHSHGY